MVRRALKLAREARPPPARTAAGKRAHLHRITHDAVTELRNLTPPPSSVQKFFVQKLLKEWWPSDLIDVLSRRSTAMIGECARRERYVKLIGNVKRLAAKDKSVEGGGRPRAALATARLLLNALPTSARTQAECLPCLFGCPSGRDSAGHYLACPNARSVVKTSTVAPPPAPNTVDFATGGPHSSRHGLLQLAVLSRLILQLHKSKLYWRVRTLVTERKIRVLNDLLIETAQAIACDYGGQSFFVASPVVPRARR